MAGSWGLGGVHYFALALAFSAFSAFRFSALSLTFSALSFAAFSLAFVSLIALLVSNSVAEYAIVVNFTSLASLLVLVNFIVSIPAVLTPCDPCDSNSLGASLSISTDAFFSLFPFHSAPNVTSCDSMWYPHITLPPLASLSSSVIWIVSPLCSFRSVLSCSCDSFSSTPLSSGRGVASCPPYLTLITSMSMSCLSASRTFIGLAGITWIFCLVVGSRRGLAKL
mmetsp:Transcript_3846/g.7324  ORF Transcript_3846/g.7324 Transcript_3846/m.7324 type:complete len:224 (+) Transcript_3846:283-954(+)